MQNISPQLPTVNQAAERKIRTDLLTASKPYLAVVVIMTILLSVWASLCPA